MKKLVIEAWFGDQKKTVELVAPSGGGDGYQVIIDKYYQGILVKRVGKWAALFNPGSDLTADDIYVLGDIIDKQLA